MSPTCSVPGCDKPHHGRGLCHTHFERARCRGEIQPLIRPPLNERFMAKASPEPNTGCWLWTGTPCSSGYGKFNIAPGVQERSHRAAWLIFRGPIPEGLYVCHRCDNRACVNPDHLFLALPAGNVADMVAKGRHSIGSRHRSAKLTDEKVAEVRAAYRAGGVTQRELAKRYGVSQQTICRATSGESWRHVSEA